MQFSNYQNDIFDAVTNTTDNLIVEAVAGSGKSTTLVEVCKRLKGSNHLFCAFNKLIADDLSMKLPKNIQCRTLNSYGWGICLKAYGRPKLDPAKTDGLIRDFVPKDEQKYVFGFIKSLVSLLKANCVYDIDSYNMLELILRQGLELPRNKECLDWVRAIYKKSITLTSVMDFDDQIFMPVYNDLPTPKFDTLLVDESQDLNPIQIELCIRSGTRIIAVGDSRQAIYGFRGADPEAIDNMRKRINARVLPLSICYRCPKDVVRAAKEIVPSIEWSDSVPDGIVATINMEKFDKESKTGDYVLCRTTAPLVSNCLRFIRNGRLATVRGRDIGKQLDSLITRISGSKDFMAMNEFLSVLDGYARKERERLSTLNREAEIIALDDRVSTIEALADAVEIDPAQVRHIKHKIEQIFSEPDANGNMEGVVFCTIHKSKGLEAERVFILKPELLPHPLAKVDWAKRQEMNLKYVAITRSKSELYWVK